MFFVCSKQAILIKYGSAGGAAVFKAVDALGPVLDVSNLSPAQIRGVIASQAPGPACLIGGYDLLPTFSMSNPSRSLVQDPDAEVFTDAPYGARGQLGGVLPAFTARLQNSRCRWQAVGE